MWAYISLRRKYILEQLMSIAAALLIDSIYHKQEEWQNEVDSRRSSEAPAGPTGTAGPLPCGTNCSPFISKLTNVGQK